MNFPVLFFTNFFHNFKQKKLDQPSLLYFVISIISINSFYHTFQIYKEIMSTVKLHEPIGCLLTSAGRIVHAQRVFVYKAIFESGGFCDC